MKRKSVVHPRALYFVLRSEVFCYYFISDLDKKKNKKIERMDIYWYFWWNFLFFLFLINKVLFYCIFLQISFNKFFSLLCSINGRFFETYQLKWSTVPKILIDGHILWDEKLFFAFLIPVKWYSGEIFLFEKKFFVVSWYAWLCRNKTSINCLLHLNKLLYGSC